MLVKIFAQGVTLMYLDRILLAITLRTKIFKMKQIRFILCLAGSIMFCSPRLTSLTANLRNEYNQTESDLQKIQFYLSDDVVFWREVRDGDAKIKDGTIKIRDGKKVEEVVFTRKTLAVFLFEPRLNQFAVSFETSDEKFLMFGPSKKRGADFVLLAADWKRDIGRISYDKKIYFRFDESAYSRLMVDLRAAKKLSVKCETVEGRTLDE